MRRVGRRTCYYRYFMFRRISPRNLLRLDLPTGSYRGASIIEDLSMSSIDCLV